MDPTELVLVTDTRKQKPSRNEIHVFTTNIAKFHIFLGREQGLFIVFTFLSLKGLEEETSSPGSFCCVVEIFGSWVGCCHFHETSYTCSSVPVNVNVPLKINFKVVL